MGNRIGRVVLGLIIGIAAIIGIYIILPGSVKNPMKEWFQKTFQSDTYAVAEKYQNSKIPNTDVTFGHAIESCGDGSHAWFVDVIDESEDKKSGNYEVHSFATKVDIAMEQENGQDNLKSFSQATIEIVFNVRKNSDGTFVTTSYTVMLDDQPQNEFYRMQALQSIAANAASVPVTTAAESK